MAEDHRRRLPTTKINIADIKIDENFIYDDGVAKAYKLLFEGKLKVSLTRFPESDIYSGIYHRLASGEIVHRTNMKPQKATLMERQIRGGHRPTVDLFWNAHCREGGGFICPDDENALEGYRRANVSLVPCRIIRPKKVAHSEGAIWLAARKNSARMDRLIAPEITGYASFLGTTESNIRETGAVLSTLCEQARSEIKAFHSEASSGVHYHQMLFAFVRRHELAIESVLDLLSKGRAEHALAVVRMAYEAFLNFYLDWLSPEFFGPRLQLLAMLKEVSVTGDDAIDSAMDSLENFPALFGNSAEKAKICPLGTLFHNAAYPALSLVVHQSYGNIEKYSSSFYDGEQTLRKEDELQLCRWLDFLTAAILIRVRNEVGK